MRQRLGWLGGIKSKCERANSRRSAHIYEARKKGGGGDRLGLHCRPVNISLWKYRAQYLTFLARSDPGSYLLTRLRNHCAVIIRGGGHVNTLRSGGFFYPLWREINAFIGFKGCLLCLRPSEQG